MMSNAAKDDKKGGSATPAAGSAPPAAGSAPPAASFPPPAAYCTRKVDNSVDISPQKTAANEFRKNYIFGSVKGQSVEEMEEKFLISPGRSIESWKMESSGLLWVGVYGMESEVCVVTKGDKSDALDMTRVTGSLTLQTIPEILTQFRKSALVEIEDLAVLYCGTHIKKPFGVVSVIPDRIPKGRRKASNFELGKSMAIEFLQEKVNSVNGDTPFPTKEIIQTAIVAFGQLIQKKLTADDIRVSVWTPKYKVHPSKGKDAFMRDLTTPEIIEKLNEIKRGTPSKRKFENEPNESSSGCTSESSSGCPKESSSGSRRLRARKRQ